MGWAKAPTGPREARPDDKLRAVPTPGYSEIRVGIAELVIGPATSGRTRWLSPPYRFLLTTARETCRIAST